jgi:transposase
MRIQGIKKLYAARGYVVKSIAIKGASKTVILKRDKRFGNSCPVCLSERTRFHKAVMQSARDYPIGDAVFTDIHYPAVQVYCIPCGQYRTRRPSLMDEHAKVTRRYMEYVSRLCRKDPANDVAELLGHSPTSICEWDEQVLRRKLPKPNLNRLRVLLVDEKSVRKGHNYVTVVMNGDTREVLFLEEGRKRETLMRFFDRLTPAQKQRIQAVGIDRGGAYLSAVREALPEAAVVFDKFHLIQNMNAAMDEIRRSEYRKALKEKSATASLIKGQRYNLFRLAENRTEAQSIRLQELLAANATLSMAHMLCEELRLLWGYRHRGYAERFLKNWVSLVEESGIAELLRFAKGLWRSRVEVLNYISHQVTTGPLESLNNIIEQILRRSCGMRNIEYLYLKVRQASLDS